MVGAIHASVAGATSWDPDGSHFNAFHKWDVFGACNAEGRFEVANIGTHEVGHTVGLDHLEASGAYATMYPTASKGEVRKQTLTQGDLSSYVAAGPH